MVCLHVAAEFGEKLLTLDESKLRSIEDLGSIGTITHHYDGRPLSTDIDREQAVEQALQEYAQWYDGQIIRDGDRVGISYIDYSWMGAWDFIQVINCAIASGDMPLTRRIAATPSRKSDFRLFPGETIWYARLLKHYILGNTAEAKESLDKLLESPLVDDEYPPFTSLGSLCWAIMEGQQQAAQSHLERHLECHHKAAKPVSRTLPDGRRVRYVETTDLLLSIPALALCRLASMKDMELEVDDKYVPKALIAAPAVLDDHAETYIQKALAEPEEEEVTWQRKNSLLSRIFPWKRG